MAFSESELSDFCKKKVKMKCKSYNDGPLYPKPMYLHGVYPNGEVSLGFKRGKGGYFDPALWEDVVGPWGEDAAEAPVAAAAAAAAAAAPVAEEAAEEVIADRSCAVMDAVGFWNDLRNQHSSVDAALKELLDNVADEGPRRCEVAARTVDDGRRLAVSLRAGKG